MEYYNKKSIWKWVVLYVLIGAVAYGLIYYFLARECSKYTDIFTAERAPKICSAYFFFYKNGGYLYNNQTNSNTQNSSTETADSYAKALATADWKTYKNDEYGFEVKYPKSWWVEERTNIITFLGPSSGPSNFALDISVESNPNKLSSKDFVLQKLKEPEMGSGFDEFTPAEVKLFNNGKELEIGGLAAFQLEENNYTHIYLARNSNIMKFYFPDTEKNITELEDPEAVNTVISTFKFTK